MRDTRMQYLEQQRTYAGVLCGRFSARDNDERIEAFVAEAQKRLPWLGRIHVLPPERETLPYKANSSAPVAERLPAVVSLAQFQSNAPANDEGEAYSSAAFLWFQAEFGLPDERTRQALRKVDWRSVADDWTP